jgi:hypothetical protein
VPLASIRTVSNCATRSQWSIHVGFSAHRAEKGLHVLAEAYRICAIGDLPEATTRSGRLHGADCKPYLEEIQKHLQDAVSSMSFTITASWIAREDRVSASLDVMSCRHVRRAERRFVARSDGVRCAAGPTTSRRVHRDRRKTGGGLLVQPDDPQSLADGILKIAKDKRSRRSERNGFRGVREHYTAAHMADKFSQL